MDVKYVVSQSQSFFYDPFMQQKLTPISLTHAGSIGLPGDRDPLPLTGSAVGDEGLTVAVFVDRTLAHVRHT